MIHIFPGLIEMPNVTAQVGTDVWFEPIEAWSSDVLAEQQRNLVTLETEFTHSVRALHEALDAHERSLWMPSLFSWDSMVA